MRRHVPSLKLRLKLGKAPRSCTWLEKSFEKLQTEEAPRMIDIGLDQSFGLISPDSKSNRAPLSP